MTRHYSLALLAVAFTFFSCKKEPTEKISFDKTYGGTNFDGVESFVKTPDGGYALTGVTESSDGDVPPSSLYSGFSADLWAIKVNKSGELQWSKKFGGKGGEFGRCIINTADGGLMVAGLSSEVSGDVTANKGSEDVWLLKLDKNGNVEWKKNYGGSNADRGVSILQEANGDYVFVAGSSSTDGDITSSKGDDDIWVVKISSSGNILWQKSLGGNRGEGAQKIISSSTGGYLILGQTGSSDVPGYRAESDLFVISLASDGTIVWQKAFGGSSTEVPGGIVRSHTGGYVVSALTTSTDGDVHGSRTSYDVWLFEINTLGNIIWEKSYPTSGVEGRPDLVSTEDGYSVAGYITPIDGHGNTTAISEAFLFKTDLNGQVLNRKNISATTSRGATAQVYLGNGRFVVMGVQPGKQTGPFYDYSDAWLFTVEY